MKIHDKKEDMDLKSNFDRSNSISDSNDEIEIASSSDKHESKEIESKKRIIEPFKCELCVKSLPRCDFCGKHYVKQEELECHIKKHHTNSPRTKFTKIKVEPDDILLEEMNVKPKKFRVPKKFKVLFQVYNCNYCDSDFKDAPKREEPILCDLCKRVFYSKMKLFQG